MKKKILYIMHVDWRWIKQRPHFIAEGLSKFYDVTVVYFSSKRYLFEDAVVSANSGNINILPAFRLPLYENRIIYALNRIYMQIYFKFLIKKYNPDFIWLTFPQLYDYIPLDTNCEIIYDCMDLATGFDFSDNFKTKISDLEEKLVKVASLVFVSSNYLFKRLDVEYQCKNKLSVIRNAFGGKIIDYSNEKIEMKKTFKIGYVGTISQWIDFENLKNTLDVVKNIEYHLIGPCEIENVIIDDRIKFYGAINHKELHDHVKNFDCLIVPFVVDNKIKSADPGKIYEYINFNKPIISVYYEELEYFSRFVYFYSNTAELLDLLENMVLNGFKRNYSLQDRIEFLKNNSWDLRVSKIVKYLDDLK